jgi:pimeloyl-ACP methyl ester carboxylesterase
LQAESRYVRANGINHHYLAWGDPEKPPLVMLHGIGLCAQVWNWSARDLARHYYVVSFDLRGHGNTDKPGVAGTLLSRLGPMWRQSFKRWVWSGPSEWDILPAACPC